MSSIKVIFAFLLLTISVSYSFLPVVSKVRVTYNNYFSMVDVVSARSEVSKYVLDHANYLDTVARKSPPPRLGILITLLYLKGEEILPPRDRRNLNPFLIPISRRKSDKSILCYIRWPTQKENMDLQLVRTTEAGIVLVSMGTDQLCHRIAAEMDFYVDPIAEAALEVANSEGKIYESGAYLPLLKSGKFPTLTQQDLELILDRYLLTKVGAFPDCYERLASSYLAKNDVVSALVTCERAVSVFYGWGHPLTFHSKMLSGLPKYQIEAKDVARAAMAMPKWTLANTRQVTPSPVHLQSANPLTMSWSYPCSIGYHGISNLFHLSM